MKCPKITIRKWRFSVAQKQIEKKKGREVMMHKKTYFMHICGCADVDRNWQHWLFSTSSYLKKRTNTKTNQIVTTIRKETI